MNHTRLAHHYSVLTPWERLPLMLAASVRGDDVEHERLAGSAPKNLFRVADFWGLAAGLSQVAHVYMIRQLDLVALYWKLTAALESYPPADSRLEDRLWKTIQLTAYQVLVHADGWKLLCDELHMDGEALLRELPGSDTLKEMEQEARQIAFTPEEALAHVRERFPGQAEASAQSGLCPLRTAADVARMMRKSLEELLDEWT